MSQTMESNMQWFGRRYDAPAWEYMTETATPAGMHCSHCTERVTEDDAGVVMPHWHPVGPTFEPIHVECFLRSVMGSVAHLEGRCSCAHGDIGASCPVEDDLTWRQQGRQVIAWLQRR